MDPKEWELYESRQMAILDYNTGILEAREDGMAKGLEQGLEQAKKYNIPINVDTIKEWYPILCA